MSIKAVCSCGKQYQVKAELAGKRVKCPACQGILQVPQAAPPPQPDPLDLGALDLGSLGVGVTPQPTLPSMPNHGTYNYGAPSPAQFMSAPRPTAVAAPKKGSSLARMVLIIGGAAGGVLLLVCGLCGFGMYLAVRPPPVSPAALQPFDVTAVGLPTFPERGAPTTVEGNVQFHEIQLGQADGQPGHGRLLWLYLPPGEHAPGSLPCVLIAPAGSTLLTGMGLGEGDQPEHFPYAQAGFAVVSYELDGIEDYGDYEMEEGDIDTVQFEYEDEEDFTNSEMELYNEFRAARAGLVNARNALEYVLNRVPEVDPKRIYSAGHSSAGTLSLLFAAHEPRLAGCIAYAPCYDVYGRFGPLGVKLASTICPGAQDFLTQGSPKTHVGRITCPVFLFHAEDDSNVPIADSRACEQALKAAGRDVTFESVATGEHYDSMIEEGVPRGIQWLKARSS